MKTLITLLILTLTLMHAAIAQNGKYADVNGLHMYYEIGRASWRERV